MTDESIVIKVTDDGTQAVIDNLKSLGLTGDEATKRVASGFTNLSNAAGPASDKIIATARAMGASAEQVNVLRSALDQMTDSEIRATSSNAALAQVFGQTANAARNAATAASAAGTAHLNYGTAATGAGVAAAGFGTKISAAGTSLQNMGASLRNAVSGVQGLVAATASYVGFRTLMDDSDAMTRITSQLKQVTSGTEQYNEIFGKLKVTADASQQPIASVVKSFYTMAQAAKDSGVSLDDLATAQDSLSKILYASSLPAAQASRVMKDFTEILSGHGNAQRLVNSLWQQAPALMNNLKDQGINLGASTQALANKTNNAADSLEHFRAKMGETSGASSASLQEQINKTTQAINTQSAAHGYASSQVQNLQTKMQGLRTELGVARSAEDAYSDAQNKASKATGGAAISAQSLISALVEADGKATSLAATVGGLFSGAFTKLNNNIIIYLGQANAVTGTLELIKDGINVLADHVNILIPAVSILVGLLAFAGVVAAIGFVTSAIGALVTGIGVVAGAIIALLGLPLFVGGAILVGGLVAIVTKMGLWKVAIDDVKSAWGSFQQWWDGFWPGAQKDIDGLNVKADKAFDDMVSAFKAAVSEIAGGVGTIIKSFESWYSYIEDTLIPALKDAMRLGNAANQGKNGATGGTNVGGGTGGATGGQTGNAAPAVTPDLPPVYALPGYTPANQSPGYDGGGGDSYAAPGGGGFLPADSAGGGFTSIAGNGAFRDGGAFSVSGSGGVDSVPVSFMASPGEVVTIQTPQQAQSGTVNVGNDNGTHFANGGRIFASKFSEGVMQGLSGASVKFQAAGTASGSASVTGYALPGNYYTNISGGAATTGSGTGNYGVDYLNAQIQQLATDQANMDSLYALWRKQAPSSINASILAKQMDSIMSSDPNVTDRRTGQTGSQFGSVGGFAGGSVSTASSSTSSVDPIAQMQAAQAKSAKLQNDISAMHAAQVITAANGVSKPTSDLMTSQQAEEWVNDNGQFVPRYNTAKLTYAGDWQSLYKTYLADEATPARNGIDLMVGGASGVDSQLLPLKVSPGEQVTVKTPQQQQAAANGGGGGSPIVINMPITTPDANSFRQSSKQVASMAANAAARVKRKVG